jgi:hypothetical protein
MTGEASVGQRKPEQPARQERRQQERRQRDEPPQFERRRETGRRESPRSNLRTGETGSERSLQIDLGQTGQTMKSDGGQTDIQQSVLLGFTEMAPLRGTGV